jgi:hypothetical protein
VTDEIPGRKLLLRGRFVFGLRQAIVTALIGSAIAAAVALSNLH